MGTLILSILMAFTVTTVPCNADTALVNDIADAYGLPVQYIEDFDWDVIDNRTPDKLVVVIVESTASTDYEGHGGYDSEGYYIGYNVSEPEGAHVTSYVVYNPYSTLEDDVVNVVDHGIIR